MNIQNVIKAAGIKNVRFLVPAYPWFSSNEKKEDIISEYTIFEDKYKLKENYKITLVSLENLEVFHDFYISDLETLINQKIIKIEIKPAFL